MTKRAHRGTTLVEAVAALAVIMFGAAGAVALQRTSNAMMGDARRSTRAAAFGQDLVSQIQLWDYTDPRLDNVNVDNDADVGDTAYRFQVEDPPPFDHDEASTTNGGLLEWTGVADDVLQDNLMQRYWNVSEVDDYNGNGVPDAKRIAVIVRWEQGGAWRRTVLLTMKVNPADRR